MAVIIKIHLAHYFDVAINLLRLKTTVYIAIDENDFIFI